MPRRYGAFAASNVAARPSVRMPAWRARMMVMHQNHLRVGTGRDLTQTWSDPCLDPRGLRRTRAARTRPLRHRRNRPHQRRGVDLIRHGGLREVDQREQ
jgi:hypothetical protein